MSFFSRRRLLRILQRDPIPDAVWREVVDSIPLLQTLAPAERARLRVLATRFLHEKTFTGGADLEPTEFMKAAVSAQACLLILRLRWDRFDGWREVILYPGGFRVTRETRDEAGVVHTGERDLSGEAWQRGVVILSWDDVWHDATHPGHGIHWYPGNVALHEFAHKLDMQSGHANGMPPLHPGMSLPEWSRALSDAYDDLQRRLDHGLPTAIDPYAATDPAEFFAVLTEAFFVDPHTVSRHYPEVYRQLRLFYHQDPLQRPPVPDPTRAVIRPPG